MVQSILWRFDYMRTLYSGLYFTNYKKFDHLLGMSISSYKRFYWSFRLTWIVFSLPLSNIKLRLIRLSSNLRYLSNFKARNAPLTVQSAKSTVTKWFLAGMVGLTGEAPCQVEKIFSACTGVCRVRIEASIPQSSTLRRSLGHLLCRQGNKRSAASPDGGKEGSNLAKQSPFSIVLDSHIKRGFQPLL